MSVFGQVWLWSLAAFVLGALLTWLLLVRPARARVRELERRVVAHRAEPVAASADYAGPANDAGPANSVSASAEPAPLSHGEQQLAPERGDPATKLFEPANPERTEYLPPTDGRTRVDFGPEPSPPAGSGIGTAFDPGQAEPAESRQPAFEQGSQHTEARQTESRHAAPEPARGLFQPALPSTPPYEQDVESALPEPAPPEPAPPEPAEAPEGDGEPASEALLPKRHRRDSPLGGFDPPEPIQPSMRAVARREPVQGGHSGSLFEPGEPEQPESGGYDDGPSEQPPSEQPAVEQSEPDVSVGPFGPGSAMPLPGGRKPSEDFTIKASVTTLRYCPPESENFDDMVAEVWFRTAHDAERVGFRPIG